MRGPMVVAVTGGVASGKSEVTHRFEALGVVVVDADVAARDVVVRGSPGLAEVIAAFGQEVLTAEGELDRPAMRRRIYADPQARRMLEAIIHPHVRTLMRMQCEQAPGDYAIAAIPLLAESGGRLHWPWLTRILVVDVPSELQLARLQLRDGVDAALARRMVEAQATRAQRLAIADDVIVNDSSLSALAPQVEALHARYQWLALQLNAQATAG